MSGRRVALYSAWSHPNKVTELLGIWDNRIPALFEVRRLFWPRFELVADPVKFDQGAGTIPPSSRRRAHSPGTSRGATGLRPSARSAMLPPLTASMRCSGCAAVESVE